MSYGRFFPPSEYCFALIEQLKKSSCAKEFKLNSTNPLLTGYEIGESIIMVVRDNGDFKTHRREEFEKLGIEAPHVYFDLSFFGIEVPVLNPNHKKKLPSVEDYCLATYT